MWLTNTLAYEQKSSNMLKSSICLGAKNLFQKPKIFLAHLWQSTQQGRVDIYPWENLRLLPQYFMGNRTDFHFLTSFPVYPNSIATASLMGQDKR